MSGPLEVRCPTCSAMGGTLCRDMTTGRVRDDVHVSRQNMAVTVDEELTTAKPDPVVELLTEIRDLLLIQIAQQGRVFGSLAGQYTKAVARQENR